MRLNLNLTIPRMKWTMLRFKRVVGGENANLNARPAIKGFIQMRVKSVTFSAPKQHCLPPACPLSVSPPRTLTRRATVYWGTIAMGF